MKIPKGWKEMQLGDVLTQPESGYSPVLEDSPPARNDLGVLRLSAVSDGSVVVDDAKLAPKPVQNSLKCSLKAGGIVITRSNTAELVGAVGIVKGDHPNRFLPDLMWQSFVKNPNVAEAPWLAMALSSSQYRPKIVATAAGTSGSMKKITKSSFLRLKLTLPPLDEQRRIAEILSTWDAAIEQTEKLLDAKQRRKRALAQQLLTGKRRFREFEGEGCPTQLGDVCLSILGGGTPSRGNPSFWGGIIPWMTVKDLKGAKVSAVEEHITTEGLQASSARLVPAGTPILATRMAVGKVVRATIDVAINQDLKAVFPNPAKMSDDFMFYILEFVGERLASLSGGSTVKGLNLDQLRGFEFHLPSLAEQQKIAAVLNAADQEVVQLKDQLAALKKQKQGLMQVLLTGKVRVGAK